MYSRALYRHGTLLVEIDVRSIGLKGTMQIESREEARESREREGTLKIEGVLNVSDLNSVYIDIPETRRDL